MLKTPDLSRVFSSANAQFPSLVEHRDEIQSELGAAVGMERLLVAPFSAREGRKQDV